MRENPKPLRLYGRGFWRSPNRPVVVEPVAPWSARGGYLNLRIGTREDYVTSLSPNEARQLTAYLNEHFPTKEADRG